MALPGATWTKAFLADSEPMSSSSARVVSDVDRGTTMIGAASATSNRIIALEAGAGEEAGEAAAAVGAATAAVATGAGPGDDVGGPAPEGVAMATDSQGLI